MPMYIVPDLPPAIPEDMRRVLGPTGPFLVGVEDTLDAAQRGALTTGPGAVYVLLVDETRVLVTICPLEMVTRLTRGGKAEQLGERDLVEVIKADVAAARKAKGL